MSMLNRFRKQGGFMQVLQLLESCDESKQESLFETLCQEDPGWGALAKKKILHLKKILSWPSEVLREIIVQTPLQIIVPIYQSLDENNRKHILDVFPPQLLKSFFNELERKTSQPNEQKQARIKFIQQIRQIINDGNINLKDFDPSLIIDSRIIE